jgi:hypothetical protein
MFFMTICIAVLLDNSVFLMTDGRLIRQFGNRDLLDDDQDKLTQIGNRFACTHFGISVATDSLINNLDKNKLENASTINEIKDIVATASFYALGSFLPRLNVTREQASALRFGILYGGVLVSGARAFSRVCLEVRGEGFEPSKA